MTEYLIEIRVDLPDGFHEEDLIEMTANNLMIDSEQISSFKRITKRISEEP